MMRPNIIGQVKMTVPHEESDNKIFDTDIKDKSAAVTSSLESRKLLTFQRTI